MKNKQPPHGKDVYDFSKWMIGEKTRYHIPWSYCNFHFNYRLPHTNIVTQAVGGLALGTAAKAAERATAKGKTIKDDQMEEIPLGDDDDNDDDWHDIDARYML